jgi:hypothetical protein
MYKYKSIIVKEIDGVEMPHNYIAGAKKVAEKMRRLERMLDTELVESCTITVFDHEDGMYRYEWDLDLAQWTCVNAPTIHGETAIAA